MSITINNEPCVAITDELAAMLIEFGEDPKDMNRMVWPQGASQWSDGRFVVTRETVGKLYTGDQGGGATLKMDDGADGVVTMTQLVLLPPRPLHVFGNSISNPDDALYEVRLTDTRYNWQFFHIDDSNFNVTKQSDRTATYSAVEQTWEDIIDAILTTLGIQTATDKTLGSLTNDIPYDYAFFGDNAAQALDRACAAIGVVFVASWDNLGSADTAKRYAISSAVSLLGKFDGTNSPYKAVTDDTLSGGPEFASGNFTGSSKFFLNRYPSSVKVLFPRQPEAGATQEDKVLDQYYEVASTVGKPVNGAAVNATHTLHSTTWAVGPATPTNAADLLVAANNLSFAYYARFSVSPTKAIWRGFVNKGRFPGTVTWKLSGRGPLSIYSTDTDYYGYGLDRSIGNDFTGAPMVGIDGIRVLRSQDGSMRIASGGFSESKFQARITGNATLATSRFKYAWTEVAMDGDDTADVSGGRSGTTTTDYALNTAEINHTSVFQFGADTSLTSYTDTAMGMRPIGASGIATTHDYDVVVEMTERTDVNGATKYTFQLMGTHDGECS